MAAQNSDPSPTLSFADWRRIDSVCDEFDADWQRQQRPNIAEHLAQVEDRLRPALSGELIRLEMEWRLRRGEPANAEQYSTECRGSAFAFATSVGRFAGAGITFLVGAGVARFHTIGTPVALTSIAFLIGLLLLPFGEETRGKVLPD